LVVGVAVPACDALNNGGGQRSRSFGLDEMVHDVVDLGGMEVGATILGASHDMVAGFVSTQATEARVGFVGVDAVDAVPNSAADG
jgi:hypothetical protein